MLSFVSSVCPLFMGMSYGKSNFCLTFYETFTHKGSKNAFFQWLLYLRIVLSQIQKTHFIPPEPKPHARLSCVINDCGQYSYTL